MSVALRPTRTSPTFAWEITARAAEVGEWRERVAVVVRGLGGDAEAVSVARLGTSELLTNVIRHVGDPWCRLEVVGWRRETRVRVFDRGREVPAIAAPDEDAEGGRGLVLLRALTDRLGYTCTPDGKWVWFEVPLTARGVRDAPGTPGSG
ncbi:ATP-binding protein [Streptomyces alkaliphilus]|uniref:ATP-binding protein n=1 Tax=Streptomyces alkaliphilus TaxID=1472722 RepID=UPI001565574B|nr:ATP-binding protein [Streptomyces alkaliphilus]